MGTADMHAASKTMKADHPMAPRVGQALDEARLVETAQAGDSAAFGRLVQDYQDRIFNVCFRILQSRQTAEDLTQEAFVKAYRSLAGFDGRATFYTWLYRIAVNLCLSQRRSSRPMLSLDQSATDDQPASRNIISSTAASPESNAAMHEEHRLVLSARAELDEEHRTVVVLRDIESLDYSQIAEILGIAVGTVKSRLHRARMTLRDRLKPLIE